MGTPEFAVETLRILVENDKNIVGVITAPDKPKGRGQKLEGSPVKKYAEEIEDDFMASGVMSQVNLSGYPELEISVEVKAEDLPVNMIVDWVKVYQ